MADKRRLLVLQQFSVGGRGSLEEQRLQLAIVAILKTQK